MEKLSVPKILNIPEKLIPIITQLNNYRYFLLEGGRGGAKSQSVARFVLYLAELYKLRVVCGREIQNSISESVYSLLSDLINQFQLYYDVFASKIIHRTKKSTINFRGFREQGSFNIQGMEGVDITWIDEAQAITKQTLDVLIPTIRKENAKIFFTMNRHVEDDPVYEFLRDRKDCLHIHLNYTDNPFCTKALIHEAEECKAKSQEDYNHIWLGIPLDKSEDALFSWEDLMQAKDNAYALREGYGYRIGGFDVARYGDDKCTAVIIQQMGALHWAVKHTELWSQKDLNYTTGRILLVSSDQATNESIIDEDGLGSGPLDTLNKGRGLEQFKGFRNPPIAYAVNKFYANRRTEYAYKVKDMIAKGHLHIPQEDIRKELLAAFKYTFDNYQRRILISKKVMREKYKIKSPNFADALIMAVSLIDEVKIEQDKEYQRQPQYSKEENLFNLSGVR